MEYEKILKEYGDILLPEDLQKYYTQAATPSISISQTARSNLSK